MGSDGMDEVDLAVDDWKCDEGLVERQDTGGMLGPNEDAVDLESVSSLLLSVLFNGVARSGRMRAGQAGRNSQYDVAREEWAGQKFQISHQNGCCRPTGPGQELKTDATLTDWPGRLN